MGPGTSGPPACAACRWQKPLSKFAAVPASSGHCMPNTNYTRRDDDATLQFAQEAALQEQRRLATDERKELQDTIRALRRRIDALEGSSPP